MTKPSSLHKNARSIPNRKIASGGANAIARARRETERYPKRVEGWKMLATYLMASEPQEARAAAQHALELEPNDPLVLDLAAQAETAVGNEPSAVEYLKKACDIAPELAIVHSHLGILLYQRTKYEESLAVLNRAETLNPTDAETLYHKGLSLFRLQRYKEADAIFHGLLKRYPKAVAYWNEAGNIKRDLGLLQEAETYYKKAEKLTRHDPVPLGNRITALHYRPDVTPEDIFEVCKEWQGRFAPSNPPARPIPLNRDPNRRLRIGMFSDGFRKHPVGSMSVRMLEARNPSDFEVYAYTTNSTEDSLTRRIRKAVEHWAPINHLSDEQFAQRIRDDQIDILIDLCGYNRGNRMRVMAMQPAPLLVKWVGGLINTTGVTAIDYLISDSIETPPGVDHLYTEKLIRMPDDYICFDPPPILPDVAELPASRNGYITLGCFNNPLKINEIVLAQWAQIMQELPDSRLFLKGHQYASEEVCERIRQQMLAHGIPTKRLILEGPSLQPILLNAYNRVDIALDPWPYSGGLTTCEAMIMGVPVVTLPGLTFAGRHSATHLVNASMPELVVNDWDEYRERVVGLAADLESLATIRQHLREILLQSPICDGRRFADNFSIAMRAIWHRYCENKPCASLILFDGGVMFEDETSPRQIELLPRIEPKDSGPNFAFDLRGKLVVVDHGAQLLAAGTLLPLLRTGAFSFVAFDPMGHATHAATLKEPDLAYIAGSALGSGEMSRIHAYINADESGSLEPSQRHIDILQDSESPDPIARFPLPTQELDAIEGLDRVDWLILDHRHDAQAIIEHGRRAVSQALVVQVSTNFLSNGNRYSNIHEIMSALDFQQYDMLNFVRKGGDPLLRSGAAPLARADVVYVPGRKKFHALSDDSRIKLAFLLHTCYKGHELAHDILKSVDVELARSYLASLAPDDNKKPQPSKIAGGVRSGKERAATTTCVGVPIYNEAKYIQKTIESLKAQTLDDVTFLISDNFSSDDTFQICQDLAGDDERFKIVRQKENIGAYGNFLSVFQNSSSRYFMWLGGHDYLSPGYLKAGESILAENGEIAMVCGRPYGFIDDHKPAPLRAAVYDFTEKDRVQRYLKSVAELGNCTIFHSLFRRTDLSNIDFKELISGDHIWISHLLWHGTLRYMDNEIYYRRYFEHRETTASERITGSKGSKLNRHDFIESYVDDFRQLCQDGDIQPNIHAKRMLEILRKRFSRN